MKERDRLISPILDDRELGAQLESLDWESLARAESFEPAAALPDVAVFTLDKGEFERRNFVEGMSLREARKKP